MIPEPPQKAVDNGHNLEWDPPHPLSRAARWTCSHALCELTAINYDGNEYGSATTKPCVGREANSVD